MNSFRWLHLKREEYGNRIVAPPALIPTEIGNRVKTDKKDSFKLVQLLEKNMLKKVPLFTLNGNCLIMWIKEGIKR